MMFGFAVMGTGVADGVGEEGEAMPEPPQATPEAPRNSERRGPRSFTLRIVAHPP